MRILLADNSFRLEFLPWEKAGILEAVKELPGRRFNDDESGKYWTVPAVPQNAAVVRRLAEKWGFSFDPAIFSAPEEMAKTRLIQSAAGESTYQLRSQIAGAPRPFQLAAVDYCLKAIAAGRGVLISDDMGLGKSLEALLVISELRAFPALIICPASLKHNWRREIAKWRPDLTTLVVNGREPRADYTADIVIVNYDILPAKENPASTSNFDKYIPEGHTAALMKMPFAAVVADESHYIKNYKSQRRHAVGLLFRRRKVRLCLSGTPIDNRESELLSQLLVLGQIDALGGFWNFKERYIDSAGTMPPAAWQARQKELNERLRATCFIRRRKEDVAKELPGKQRVPVLLEVDLRRVDRETAKSLKAMGNLRQVNMTEIDQLKLIVARAKLPSIIEWVENFRETGRKLILFAHHIEIQDALRAAFPEALYLGGGMSAQTRDTVVQEFQNGRPWLVIASLQAAGVGLTLTAASDVAFCELGWTPGQMAQAEDRAHRIGQTNPVTVYYFIGEDTIDEDIAGLIESKRATVEMVTDGELYSIESGNILTELLAKLRTRFATLFDADGDFIVKKGKKKAKNAQD